MPRLRKERAEIARERSARVKHTRQAWAREFKAREQEVERRGLYDNVGAMNCWCGGEFGHDWPGREGGAPHPR